MDGLTGKIKFDSRGFRSDFDLDIVELKKEGLSRVGRWNRGSGANFTRNFTESYSEIIESLHNKTLVVTTILAEPYTMYKENSVALLGSDQFEGYNVDLVDAISKILGFNYSIRVVEDGKHGSYNKDTGTWNGMVGELLSQKADLAVADLTITYEREQGVDFTMPFMNLGVTILFTKPTAKDPNLFSFLSPLSLGVWIYMATAYLAVSLLLYLLARELTEEASEESEEPVVPRLNMSELSIVAIVDLVLAHLSIWVISFLVNTFISDFLRRKRNGPTKKILDHHLLHQTRLGLLTNLPRFFFLLRIVFGSSMMPVLQHPIAFLGFYIPECIFTIGIVTSIDVNALLRYLLIFHESSLVQWKPEIWWLENSKILVHTVTVICVLGLCGDVLGDIVLGTNSYDGLLSFWTGWPTRSNLIFPTLNISYHLVASIFTLWAQYQIRTLVQTNFVARRGLSSRQKRHRHQENAQNFTLACICQLFRLVSVLGLNILTLLPPHFTSSHDGRLTFLSLFTFYSFYVSCCPAFSHGLAIFLNSYHKGYLSRVAHTPRKLSSAKIFTISDPKDAHNVDLTRKSASTPFHLFQTRFLSASLPSPQKRAWNFDDFDTI
eukprot:maker-scaffold28_size608977-snap-gene-0.8 protein:Tk05735 transcript:maker-scaffold28_size608977-snap-gene-0.8-mRNA-1 annotation:"glutamate ionotropic kainate 2"